MPARSKRLLIRDAIEALENIADPALAQEWDNVGLIAGDPNDACRGVMLCIDMTDAVVDEADAASANLIVAYHPPIFRALKRLVAGSGETDAVVLRALRRGMHVYALHTALDAADGGTNDVIAGLCGIERAEAFEDIPAESPQLKVVVFAPVHEVDRVAEAMFAAGAGHIGRYEKCSYRLRGEGTFLGTEGSHPSVGRRGRFETVQEIRLESVVPPHAVANVLQAIRLAHSYEEPAVDVYPLRPPRMRRGIGRIGTLRRPTTLASLARRLRRAVGAPAVRIIGDESLGIRRAAICVGSAGRLPETTPRLSDCEALVTGEVSHHDALHWRRRAVRHGAGFGVVVLGHWYSERPVLNVVVDRLRAALAGLTTTISKQDHDPFHGV
jgi:dinuclear metal center YbgI/SA1388 family protein